MSLQTSSQQGVTLPLPRGTWPNGQVFSQKDGTRLVRYDMPGPLAPVWIMGWAPTKYHSQEIARTLEGICRDLSGWHLYRPGPRGEILQPDGVKFLFEEDLAPGGISFEAALAVGWAGGGHPCYAVDGIGWCSPYHEWVREVVVRVPAHDEEGGWRAGIIPFRIISKDEAIARITGHRFKQEPAHEPDGYDQIRDIIEELVEVMESIA